MRPAEEGVSFPAGGESATPGIVQFSANLLGLAQDVPVFADRNLEAPQGVLGEGSQPALGAISIALAGVISS